MRVLILLAFISAASATPELKMRPHLARAVSRIYGGNDTTIQTYPYMSNMLIEFVGDSWLQVCGGSLITPSTILSAANCFYGSLASGWRVRLGSTFASSGGSVHLVLNFLVHEDFVGGLFPTNDVAIVRLTTRATLSDSIGLARIAGPNYHLSDGTQVTTIGWGQTSTVLFPEILQHVNISIIDQELCKERYAYVNTQPSSEVWPNITDGMLCAGILDTVGKNPCYGDSGGPLVHQGDIVVGVISWEFLCFRYFHPAVFARVSYYSDWIVVNGAG